MTLAGLFLFAGIYAAAVASPGPGIAAVVARALGHGLRGIPFFIAGFVLGDLTLMLVAVTGLAVIVKTIGPLLLAVKLAGVAYLIFLAWRLWHAPGTGPDESGDLDSNTESPLRLFLGTYSLTVGNPKAIVFFMAILPTIVDLHAIDTAHILAIALVIVLLMPIVLGSYALAANHARQMLTDAKSIRVVNRATAVVMAGAAVAVAAS